MLRLRRRGVSSGVREGVLAAPISVENERLVRIENARAERLAGEISAWRLAAETRDYVSPVRARLDEHDEATRVWYASGATGQRAGPSRTDPVANPELIEGIEVDEAPTYPRRQ
jgi:hypothetical protein